MANNIKKVFIIIIVVLLFFVVVVIIYLLTFETLQTFQEQKSISPK